MSPCTPGTVRRSVEIMTDAIDWDSAYKGDGEFQGPPPWNIGEPQPELAALIAAGECGHLTWPHFGRCSSRMLAPSGW